MDKPLNPRVPANMCMHQLQHHVAVGEHQPIHQVLSPTQVMHTVHQMLPSSQMTPTMHQVFPSSQTTHTILQTLPSQNIHSIQQVLPSCQTTQSMHQVLPSSQTTHSTRQVLPSPQTTQCLHQVLPSSQATQTIHAQVLPSTQTTHCVHQVLTSSQATHPIQQVLPSSQTTQSLHQVLASSQTTHCVNQVLSPSQTTHMIHQVLPPSQVRPSAHQVLPSSQSTHAMQQVLASSLTTNTVLNQSTHPQVSQYFSQLSRPICMTTSTTSQFEQDLLRFDGSLEASGIQVGVSEQKQDQPHELQLQQQQQQPQPQQQSQQQSQQQQQPQPQQQQPQQQLQQQQQLPQPQQQQQQQPQQLQQQQQQQQPQPQQQQQQQQPPQQLQQQQQQQQELVTTDIQSISNMINEKVLIYRHPLFPLLRILFEKCEVATNSIDALHAITFDNEIKAFITEMAKENKPFFTEDAEVDALMLKSLQVLRIHMLELEKVNELCKDFCTRYISCLRGKLNSDNIMKTLEINTTPPSSPSQQVAMADTSSLVIDDTSCSQTQSPTIEQFKFIDHKPLLEASLLHCSDPNLMSSVLIQPDTHKIAATTSPSCVDSIMESVNGIPVSELTSGFLSKKNKCGKRGVLPKQATNVMKAWLFQHLVHPYPSEEEKKQLAEQTNLSNLQVNNWFINARRRILQPMLETTSSFLKNNKKAKLHRNAAQNNWTNSIGVYSAYRTENLQHQSTTPSVAIVVSPTMVPQSSAVIVNLSDGQTQPVIISQPLQFVQVSQIPVQAVSSGCINGQSAIAQVTTISTTQASIVVPLLHEKMTTESLMAGLSES